MTPISGHEELHAFARAVDVIGEGTYGAVGIVWDPTLQCTRAVKHYFPQDDDVEDFGDVAIHEIAYHKLISELQAPHIVQLLHIFIGPGTGIATLMPAMDADLAEYIDEELLGSWAEYAVIVADVLRALHFLHTCDPPLMHRDIKPENVLVAPHERAYLTDFGFMRFQTQNDPSAAQCARAGGSNQRATPTYTAPEMMQHGLEHDGKVDLWAVGVMSLELSRNERLRAETDKSARRYIKRLHSEWQGREENLSWHEALCHALLWEPTALRATARTALELHQERASAFTPPPLASLETTDSSSAAGLTEEQWRRMLGHIEAPLENGRRVIESGDVDAIDEELGEALAKTLLRHDYVVPDTFYLACSLMQRVLEAMPSLSGQQYEKAIVFSCLFAAKVHEPSLWCIKKLASQYEPDAPESWLGQFVKFQEKLLLLPGVSLLAERPTFDTAAARIAHNAFERQRPLKRKACRQAGKSSSRTPQTENESL